MGVQLAADSNFAELDNVNLSDSELVYHVRNALKTALEVKLQSQIFAQNLFFF